MKITRFYAKNVLTFGSDGFEWNDIPDRAFIVGPNGVGKTNAFRLISLVGNAFLFADVQAHEEAIQEIRSEIHSPKSLYIRAR